MAYTIKLQTDGHASFGNFNGDFVNLQPASSDYPLGGYAITGQEQVLNNPGLTANCDLYKVLAAIPIGGQGGYSPVWNPTTQKLEVFQDSTAQGPGGRVIPGTDLSAFTFGLLLLGF